MINLAMGVKKRRNCAGRNGGWRKAIRGDLAMRAATRERMISIMARELVISVLTKKVTYTFTIVRSKKRKLQRSEL